MSHAPIAEKIKVKIFSGIHMSVEINHLLSQSTAWKELLISPSDNPSSIKVIRYQSKDYLGMYLEQESNTVAHFRMIEKIIKEKLQEICPKLILDNCKCVIFPHILVS